MSNKNTKKINDELSSNSEEEEEVVKKVNIKVKATKNKKQIKKEVEDKEADVEEKEPKLLNKKKMRKESNEGKTKNINKNIKKIVKPQEEELDDEEIEEVKPNKKKGKKQIPIKKEESDNDNNDDEEEDVKPKQKPNPKKEQKKESIEEEEAEDEQDNEPKLVKSEDKIEEAPKKKTFSPGTCNELFIKNLSYQTTQEGLAEFFQKYGDIEETKVVYDKITQRSKGVGFCRFFDYESAARAMEDAGTLTLDGRPIAISYSNDKPPISKAKISEFKSDTNFQGERFGVFVGNLSFKSNEKGIENFFKDCGKIIDIRIAKTPEGKLRGFAHVDLDSKESVEKALKKTGLELDGREIRIDRSEQKPRTEGNRNENNSRGSFGGNRSNFRGNKQDMMSKAKKSGSLIQTESKSKELVDSDEDAE